MTKRALTDAQIASVHELSLRTLAEVGILMEHERARALLAQAGACVAPESNLVKIPPAVVERAMASVPSEFAMPDFVLGCDTPPRARPVMSLDWILDRGAKQRRQVTKTDLENWVKVANALPNLSLVTGLYAWDWPEDSRDLRAAQAVLEHSTKPMLIAPFSGWTVHWIVEMLGVLPDQRRPRAIVFSSCNSPLIYSQTQMDGLLAAVESDLPVMVNSSAVTGASAPVTLAGSLVIMNAEILAGLTVSQLAKSGAKAIYAGHPIALDMATSIASAGCPEVGLLQAAMVDMGRSYRVPTTSNGMMTDSHACDEGAAVDKLLTGYDALLCGAALNGGAGSLGSISTVSLEQLAIDDDIYGRLLRMNDGIAFSEETLAWETIAAVGANGHYLEEPHTVKHMRREFRRSKLANRQNPEVWIRQGGRDIVETAAERVQTILRGAAEPVLEPRAVAELEKIVAAAERRS